MTRAREADYIRFDELSGRLFASEGQDDSAAGQSDVTNASLTLGCRHGANTHGWLVAQRSRPCGAYAILCAGTYAALCLRQQHAIVYKLAARRLLELLEQVGDGEPLFFLVGDVVYDLSLMHHD